MNGTYSPIPPSLEKSATIKRYDIYIYMSQTFKSYPINKLSFQAFPCHVALAVGLPFRDQRQDVCRHPFWDWHAALGKGYTAILEFPSHLKISKIHLKILKVKKVQAVFLAGTLWMTAWSLWSIRPGKNILQSHMLFSPLRGVCAFQ